MIKENYLDNQYMYACAAHEFCWLCAKHHAFSEHTQTSIYL